MDVRLQAKLLRAVQERQIDRVGGTKPVKLNIRIIATSNRNLQEAVKAGEFREDLFFRLNVVNLRVPPLRERPADIQILAAHFAAKYSEVNQVVDRKVGDDAMKMLTAHNWPGNVRELENALHRAVLLATGDEITPSAILLPDGSGQLAGLSTPAPSQDGAAEPAGFGFSGTASADPDAAVKMVGKTVAEVERELIIDTLKHCLGNRTHAANILGISIRTLRNKLNQYNADGVTVPQPGEAASRVPI